MLRTLAIATTLTFAVSGCGTDSVTFEPSGGGAGGMGGDVAGGAGMGGDGMGGVGNGPPPPGCGDGVMADAEECDGADLGTQDCTDFGFSDAAGLSCDGQCELVNACAPTCDAASLEPGEDCDGAEFAVDCTDYEFSTPTGGTCTNCSFDSGGCMAACDGVLQEVGEDCDGFDLNNMTCMDFGYSNPNGLSCDGSCAFNAGGCLAVCDGQLLEPGEVCDGNDLGGFDCTAFGYVGVAGLTCDANNCTLNSSGCTAVCGNLVPEPGEECDNDTGPAAGDGCDANCQEEGDSCANAIPITLALGSSSYTGSTVGGGQHSTSQCQGEGNTPDRVFEVTVASDGFLTAHLPRTSTDYDSVLYALTSCQNPVSGIMCADQFANNAPNGAEVISFEVQAGNSYIIVVDGWQGATGNFELQLDLSAGTCADPVPYPLWSGGFTMAAIGSIFMKPDNTSSSCGGLLGSDVVYEVTPLFTGNVEARVDAGSTSFSAVLEAQSLVCQLGFEIACDFDPVVGNDEVINVNGGNGTPFYVIVDSAVSAIGGSAYRLELSPP